MISWCLATLLLAQSASPATTVPTRDETAPALVSRMLARYAAAQRLRGQIVFTQRLDNRQARTVTDLQVERPSKLFIRQVLTGPVSGTAIVTSDGTSFSYPVPVDLATRPGERLVEPVEQMNVKLDTRRIYAIVGRSLLDRSSSLDILIGRLEDLRFLRNQWATLGDVPDQSIPGARAIGGQWREYGEAPVTAAYQMWIDGNANLRRFQMTENIALRPGDSPKTIVSQWDVDVAVDGPTDPGLFTVLR